MNIWDLSGQERFRHMWNDFLRGAGLTILVCDSTEDSVLKAKELVEKYSRALGSKVIAIANKQDLPDAISATEVERKLGGVKTYGMCAIREDLRHRLKQILEFEILTDKQTI